MSSAATVKKVSPSLASLFKNLSKTSKEENCQSRSREINSVNFNSSSQRESY